MRYSEILEPITTMEEPAILDEDDSPVPNPREEAVKKSAYRLGYDLSKVPRSGPAFERMVDEMFIHLRGRSERPSTSRTLATLLRRMITKARS